MKPLIDPFFRWTGIGNLPVRVRGGVAAGARWTLYPFSSYWRGTSDTEAASCLDRFCKPGGAALDLGAHFGLYAVGMALRTGPTGQVVALEPDPVARARCELHVSMNKLGSVRIYGEAASSATGSIGFVDDSDAGSTTGHVSKDPSAGVPIPCVRLDDLYSRDGLRNPDFIKIDVENHGAEALAGATTLLAGRPAIMMSFHSEHELAGTEAILGSLGYRVVSLTGQSITWAQALYKTAILNASGG